MKPDEYSLGGSANYDPRLRRRARFLAIGRCLVSVVASVLLQGCKEALKTPEVAQDAVVDLIDGSWDRSLSTWQLLASSEPSNSVWVLCRGLAEARVGQVSNAIKSFQCAATNANPVLIAPLRIETAVQLKSGEVVLIRALLPLDINTKRFESRIIPSDKEFYMAVGQTFIREANGYTNWSLAETPALINMICLDNLIKLGVHLEKK
jgi:hypothetical protein